VNARRLTATGFTWQPTSLLASFGSLLAALRRRDVDLDASATW
jgi:hypothetical protein